MEELFEQKAKPLFKRGLKEEFSLKPLSKGLGFYKEDMVEGDPAYHLRQARRTFYRPPEEIFSAEPEKWDLEDSNTYKHLLALLEKPYLGEKPQADPPFARVADSSARVADPSSSEGGNMKEIPAFAGMTVGRDKDPSVGSAHSAVSSVRDVVPREGGNLSTYKKEIPASAGMTVGRDVVPADPADPAFAGMTVAENRIEKTFFLKAYLIDTLAISLLFFPSLVAFIFLTQPAPLVVAKAVWLKVLVGFLLFSQVYCLLCRLFCFETFGEAGVKVRLCGFNSKKEVSPFHLFWRFGVSCVTGVVVLPLLSFIFRKDLTGRLTRLYFQKT